MVERICAECGGRIVQTCFGEYTCSKCGLVYESAPTPSWLESRVVGLDSLEPFTKVIFSPLGSYIGKRGETVFKDFQGRVLPLNTLAVCRFRPLSHLSSKIIIS